jgi:uncharacterized protein (DUF488 family)
MNSCRISSVSTKSKSQLKEIYAIGHSTHTIEKFISLLKAHNIKSVIDIRTVPKSLHCPQFNKNELKRSLKAEGISYQHMKDLGGFRRAAKDSINTGWKNASFRGYADYMQTPSFQKSLEKLEKTAEKKRCVLLCAEAVPWRCHRSLVLDALSVRKWKAFHIQSHKTAKRHKRTSFLKIKKGKLIYQ